MRILSLNNRKFIKDFKLPLIATAVFGVMLFGMVLSRTLERVALANVLDNNSSIGGDYATLLSNDKVDELKKGEVENQVNTSSQNNSTSEPNSTQNSPSTETSFTVSPDPEPTPTPETPATPAPGPAPVFSATIDSMVFKGARLECTSGTQSPTSCTKFYSFEAKVVSQNGPGKIDYSWTINPSSGANNGTINVGTGQTSSIIEKSFGIPCSVTTINFVYVQLRLISPNLVGSAPIQQPHKCFN